MPSSFADGANARKLSVDKSQAVAPRLPRTLITSRDVLSEKQKEAVIAAFENFGSDVQIMHTGYNFNLSALVEKLNDTSRPVTHLLIILDRPGFNNDEPAILEEAKRAGIKHIALLCLFTDQSLAPFSKYVTDETVKLVAVTSYTDHSRLGKECPTMVIQLAEFDREIKDLPPKLIGSQFAKCV